MRYSDFINDKVLKLHEANQASSTVRSVPASKPLVIVESPFSATTPAQQKINLDYARAALADALARGEAPFASHLLYTQDGVLDDDIADERTQGIEAGFAWLERADYTAVYEDLGVSDGMRLGIERAENAGLVIVYRSIASWGTAGH